MTSNRVHQLSNGLYVSGTPDKYKDKLPTMTSSAMPYTGGDIKKSGELGKMFDIAVEAPRLKKSGPLQGGALSAGSFRAAASNSGPLNSSENPATRSSIPNSGPQGLSMGSQVGGRPRQAAHSGPLFRNGDPANVKNAMYSNPRGVSSGTNLRNSGPLSSGGVAPGMVRQNSGPLAPNLPATGLITSGPITSVPPSSSKKHSGPLDGSGFAPKLTSSVNNHAINNLSNSQMYSFKRSFPRVILWTVVPLFLIGFVAGGFILAAVQNAVLLIVVICLLCAILVLLAWNTFIGKGAVTGFIIKYPDADWSQVKDGHYVKVTGVVTCGNVPLESSYQRVPRCVYTSSGLYEYRDFKGKSAGTSHRRFTWGLRHLERYAVDFYISDLKSGERALVKAGYGANVTPYVEESTVVDVTDTSKEIPSLFLRWLSNRNLSRDNRVMRLTEGYIKEGFIVTVMGVMQRNENVLMIVPPSEPVSTGCQWGRCLLPATMEGLLLRCEDDAKADIIPV
ncbi:hypothetical protein GOP47_0017970 [Adiantum capillus-veneris]|uniref:Ubiquitin-specific protease family C19-related protein n=1 Tax=Adiantum capillus-veneris TaxID=13818 RepID=A0A9D4UGV4_ADICA|nr:hypothetical protein GOP47_0017970 [Adiantum capillus-veneris]